MDADVSTVPGFVVEALRGVPAAAALSAAEFAGLARSVMDELEARVGYRLMEGLTPAQVDEFEAVTAYEQAHQGSFPDGDGPAGAWLTANLPNYGQVAREETARIIAQTRILLGEVPGLTAP